MSDYPRLLLSHSKQQLMNQNFRNTPPIPSETQQGSIRYLRQTREYIFPLSSGEQLQKTKNELWSDHYKGLMIASLCLRSHLHCPKPNTSSNMWPLRSQRISNRKDWVTLMGPFVYCNQPHFKTNYIPLTTDHYLLAKFQHKLNYMIA